MKNIWLLLGSLVVTLGLVVGVAFLFAKKANAPITPSDETLVLGGAVNVKGPSDAPITIVEFSDLQCPACRAAQPLVNLVMKEASSSARLVFRHFPLRSLHPNAAIAARASEAAANQEKFFEYHDVLYDRQEEWSGESDPSEKFVTYAKELGLDTEKFATNLKDESLDARIANDEQDGAILGVSGTPTFYVNNIKTDVNSLQRTVEELLAQSSSTSEQSQ